MYVLVSVAEVVGGVPLEHPVAERTYVLVHNTIKEKGALTTDPRTSTQQHQRKGSFNYGPTY